MRFLEYLAYKTVVKNSTFGPSTVSAVFRIRISGYNPYVRSQSYLQYFGYTSVATNLCSLDKSVVTDLRFVPSGSSAVLRVLHILISGYKPNVGFQPDFCSISNVNRW